MSEIGVKLFSKKLRLFNERKKERNPVQIQKSIASTDDYSKNDDEVHKYEIYV